MSFYKINPSKVDWEDKSSVLFFNERHGQKKLFLSYIPRLPHLKSQVWLCTSGRTCPKWTALSKQAMLVSARSVNRQILVTAKDRFGVCLPLFHVGGLSMMARAHLAQSSCFLFPGQWKPRAFVKFLTERKITLTSLVPAQVYDLVHAGLVCPPFLRAVVVGGAHLGESLYLRARKLNWPLLASYGLTECASQVATASLNSLKEKKPPLLQALSHVRIKIIRGEIALKSPSLLTGFVPLLSDERRSEFQDPKKAGWYFTQDRGRLRKGFLQVEGGEQIKILGEKVNLKNLEETLTHILLESDFPGRCVLLPVPAQREGFQLVLVSDVFNRLALGRVVRQFNSRVSPFEKIGSIYFVPQIPLTGLSKISHSGLREKLGFSRLKRGNF